MKLKNKMHFPHFDSFFNVFDTKSTASPEMLLKASRSKSTSALRRRSWTSSPSSFTKGWHPVKLKGKIKIYLQIPKWEFGTILSHNSECHEGFAFKICGAAEYLRVVELTFERCENVKSKTKNLWSENLNKKTKEIYALFVISFFQI